MIIHFHVAGGTTTVSPSDGNVSSFFAWYGVAQMQMDESLASIIACGALDRYPSLRVVIGEGGIGWIPYLLDRMDYELVDQRERLDGVLTEKPSVLFRRQMYATFQKETYGQILDKLSENIWVALIRPYGRRSLTTTSSGSMVFERTIRMFHCD